MNRLDILEKLIGFDTVSHRSNLALINFVEALLKKAGFRTTRLPSPCGEKAGLYAEIGPEVAGGLLLSAHTDVVPVEGQDWSKPPFKLTSEGGKFFGRGTTDMKGFVACALALAIKTQNASLKRPLALVLSYDEEIGCVGLQQIQSQLASLLKAPALCIVGEPTEMQIATGHKGKSAYKAIFHGEAGHSALAPRFQNALHLAADFITGLRALQSEIAQDGPFDDGYDVPYTTLHVGTLSGGTALNIVPEMAEMKFEMRSLAAQDVKALYARIEALATRGGAAQVDLSCTNSYPGLDVDATLPWVREIQNIAAQSPTKVAFGTEAGVLSDMGVPTLVCGPGSMAGQGHKADESIEAEQLETCDAFLSRLLERFC
ncbi:MAG: acetylornithine deacetylase [Litoreibacter sp.]|nr:acetylornithine deacetylase [Litoreibacter sp.]